MERQILIDKTIRNILWNCNHFAT